MAKAKKQRGRAGLAGSISQGEMLEAVHQIWLAGVGAVANAKKDGPKVFEKLLAEGARMTENSRTAADDAVRSVLEQVQSTVGERVKGARSQTTEALDSLERIFQTRVHRVLNQLGVPSSDEIAALSKRVDALNASVSNLAGKRAKRGVSAKKKKSSRAKARSTSRSKAGSKRAA